MLPKSVLAWLVILALAIANGVFREAVLLPALGEPAALILSGLLLSLLILLVAYGLVRRMRGITLRQGFAIGILWLTLTVAFEFSFGRHVQHLTWEEMLEAYTFRGGNVWPLVLLVTLVAPCAAAWLHAKRGARMV